MEWAWGRAFLISLVASWYCPYLDVIVFAMVFREPVCCFGELLQEWRTFYDLTLHTML